MAKSKGPTEPPNPDTWDRLGSFVEGLYEEMDKLSKKDPGQYMSQLAKERVNRAIRDARGLMAAHDDYIAELVEFNLENKYDQVRDAVLILREIRQGLSRLDDRFDMSAVARS